MDGVSAAELGAPSVAVIGTLTGLAAGLLAPFLAERAQARAARRAHQADLARAVLALFEGDQSLARLLCGPTSAARRKLFLLANQLKDGAARQACIDLVAVAGVPSPNEELVDDCWTTCVETLGQVARSG